MKRYLIKETATGTENNKLFKNESRIRYFGKGHKTNVDRTIFEEDYKTRTDLMEYVIKHLAEDYGYSSLSGCLHAIESRKKDADKESEQGFNTFKQEIYIVEI